MKRSILLPIIILSLTAYSQTITWNKTYDFNQKDKGGSIIKTLDGGFVVAGKTGTFDTTNLLICRIDAFGDTLWTRTYPAEGYSSGSCIAHADNGYIVTGLSSPNNFYALYRALVLKTDLNGDTVWTRTFDKTNRTAGTIIKTLDGNYVFMVGSSGYVSVSFDLIKIDENGSTIWNKTFTWPSGVHFFNSLEQDDDGDFLIAGECHTSGYSKSMVTKINSGGDSLWTKYYYGEDEHSRANYALPLENNKILICGTEDIPDYTQNKLRITKINSTGSILWETEYYEQGDNYLIADMKNTGNGDFLLAGLRNHHMFIMKIDSNGDSIWTQSYQQNQISHAANIETTLDNGIIVCCNSGSSNGYLWDLWLLKLENDGTVSTNGKVLIPQTKFSYSFPNPFSDQTTITFFLNKPERKITIKIFDISGNVFYQKDIFNLNSGKNKIDFQAKEISSGLLYYSIEGNYFHECKSMINVK